MGDHHWTQTAAEAHLAEHRGALDDKERRIAQLVGALIACLAVGLVIAAIVAVLALQGQAATRRSASARITKLNDRIVELSDQVEQGNRRIGELTQQVAALQEQVRQLGGEPVVVNVDGKTTTSSTPSTTSTTAPPTTTTTTPPSRNCVAGIVCIGG